MNAQEFISVATQLIAGEGEGRFRSAVSRAYYGAFHTAREFLGVCGSLIPINSMAHRSVAWCLSNSADPDLEDAGTYLESLRDARNDADYDLSGGQFATKTNAMAELRRAVKVTDILGNYSSEEARTGVRPQLRAYALTLGLPVQGSL
jgi:uncharacterized protein (UPF0332 family)